MGHEREGYGLAFSHKKEGMLVSGSDDGIVCIWDICQSESKEVKPLTSMRDAHSGQVIEDVQWSHFSENELVSVGDDKCLRVWDIRSGNESCIAQSSGQTDDLMCVDTSAFDPYIIATGSNDNQVSLWD